MIKPKTIYKGKVIKLVTQDVVLPTKRKTRLEVVQHPGAVLVIPFLSAHKVVLLRQYRPVIKKYIYELPAGTLEPGEKPLVCAKREIREETGYAAKTVKRLGIIYPVPGYSTEKIIIYAAKGLYHNHAVGDDDEIIHPEIKTKQEIKALFKTGKLIDAKTISAFTLCGWL